MDTLSLPFTARVLGGPPASNGIAPASDFTALLPATNRTKQDHIIVPGPDLDFLERELLVKKINAVQDWLWICGRPMPPRPLHHQIVISREIVVTESPELHLVWSKHRIFLKPIPAWLLEPDFWAAHILEDGKQPNLRRRELAACARGFMFSYSALISYESDFYLARENGLLPRNVTWEGWRLLTRQLLQSHCYAAVNPRYWYGELRLSRLNKIYRFHKGYMLRGYSKVAAHTVYVDLIRDNFGVLAGILGYVVIVLTAMQVGLGTERLQTNTMFQDVSYGFTVFSIIAPLIGVFAIVVGVLALFFGHWAATTSYEKSRFREMGVEPFWRKQHELPPKIANVEDTNRDPDSRRDA